VVKNLIDIQIGAWVIDPDQFSGDWSVKSICRKFLREETVLTGMPTFGKVYPSMLPDLLLVVRLFSSIKKSLEKEDLWQAFLLQVRQPNSRLVALDRTNQQV